MEIKKKTPKLGGIPAEAVEETQTQEGYPYAQELIQTAMEQFALEGNQVQYVSIAPFAYPELVSQVGQTVQFPVLYGYVSMDLYGLQIFVRRKPDAREEWSSDYWYEMLMTDHEENAFKPLDSLIVRIAKTWESCNSQCQSGFQCPLLAEVGVDLDGEVLECCTALRDIETLMSNDEASLDAASLFFYNDTTEVSELPSDPSVEPSEPHVINDQNESSVDGNHSS